MHGGLAIRVVFATIGLGGTKMDGKYHREIGFPQVALPSGPIRLTYSDHAKQAVNDRYGKIPLINMLHVAAEDIFEIVVRNGRVVKYAIRVPYQNGLDLSMVLTYTGRVVTHWLNKSDDTHATLRHHEYATV